MPFVGYLAGTMVVVGGVCLLHTLIQQPTPHPVFCAGEEAEEQDNTHCDNKYNLSTCITLVNRVLKK